MEAGTCSYVTCDECGEYHTAEVHWLDGANGRRGRPFFECTADPSIGRVWLKLEQLQLLEASFSNLCEFLAHALCTRLDCAPVVTGRLVKLGHLEIGDGRDVRLFIARGLHRSDASSLLAPRIGKLRNTVGVVLSPPPAGLNLEASSFAIEAGELLTFSSGSLSATATPILRDAGAPTASPTLAGNVFRKQSDFWQVVFEGESTTLKHSRGAEYLERLFSAQGEVITALSLYSGSPFGGDGKAVVSTLLTELAEDNLASLDDYDSGRVADASTLKVTRASIEFFQRQIERARQRGQSLLVVELTEQLDAAKRVLAMSTNDKGQPRRMSDANDSARSNVQQAIKRVLDDFQVSMPKLYQHLKTTLRTGATLSYSPDHRVKWILEK